MIKYGESLIDQIYYGQQMINKVYYGKSLIFNREEDDGEYWIKGTTVEPNQEVNLIQANASGSTSNYKVTSDDNCEFVYEEPVNTWGKYNSLYLFQNNKNIRTLDLSNVEIPEICIRYNEIFNGCSNLEEVKLPKNFWTSNVTDWYGVFYGANKLNLSELFKNSDFSNITYFSSSSGEGVFPHGTKFTQDFINNLDLNPEITTLCFFQGIDLSDLDLSKFEFLIKSSTRIFERTKFNENSVLPKFPNFNDSFLETFKGCVIPETIINNLTYFENATAFDNTFDNSWGYENLNPNWKITGDVYRMESTFANSGLKTADFSNINFSSPTFTATFEGCTELRNVKFGDVPVIYSTSGMFRNSGIESFNFSETFGNYSILSFSAGDMFYNCSNLQTVDFDDFCVYSTISASSMFYNCSNLQTISFSETNYNCDFTNLQEATNMFAGCQAITKLKLRNFGYNGSNCNLIDISFLFNGCSSLYEVDFLNNDGINIFENVEWCTEMFSGCDSLSIIHCNNETKAWLLEHADEICLPDIFRDEYYNGWRNY